MSAMRWPILCVSNGPYTAEARWAPRSTPLYTREERCARGSHGGARHGCVGRNTRLPSVCTRTHPHRDRMRPRTLMVGPAERARLATCMQLSLQGCRARAVAVDAVPITAAIQPHFKNTDLLPWTLTALPPTVVEGWHAPVVARNRLGAADVGLHMLAIARA